MNKARRKELEELYDIIYEAKDRLEMLPMKKRNIGIIYQKTSKAQSAMKEQKKQ